MIKIKKIDIQAVEHFDPEGKSLGFLNEYEATELRCQIAEEKAVGYFLKFNEQKIGITPDGKITDWVPGLFDTIETLFARLFKAQRLQRQ